MIHLVTQHQLHIHAERSRWSCFVSGQAEPETIFPMFLSPAGKNHQTRPKLHLSVPSFHFWVRRVAQPHNARKICTGQRLTTRALARSILTATRPFPRLFIAINDAGQC